MRTKKFAALERRCSDRSDGAGRGGRDLSRPFGRAPADARGQKKPRNSPGLSRRRLPTLPLSQYHRRDKV